MVDAFPAHNSVMSMLPEKGQEGRSVEHADRSDAKRGKAASAALLLHTTHWHSLQTQPPCIYDAWWTRFQLILVSCQCALKKVKKVGPLSMQTGAMQNETGGTAQHMQASWEQRMLQRTALREEQAQEAQLAQASWEHAAWPQYSDRPSRLASSTPPFDSA